MSFRDVDSAAIGARWAGAGRSSRLAAEVAAALAGACTGTRRPPDQSARVYVACPGSASYAVARCGSEGQARRPLRHGTFELSPDARPARAGSHSPGRFGDSALRLSARCPAGRAPRTAVRFPGPPPYPRSGPVRSRPLDEPVPIAPLI